MRFKAKTHYDTPPTEIVNSKQKRRTHRKTESCHLCCLSIMAVLILLSLSRANLMHYGVIIFQKNAPHDDKAFKSFLKTCAYNL